MTLVFFILLHSICAIIDFAVTWAFATAANIDLLVSRLIGASTAFVVVAYAIRRRRNSSRLNSTLPLTISATISIVSYALFALMMVRNPQLQWPVVFAATSVAALVLGGFGYARALKSRD
ncbi:hypothetical protein [Rhizobium sp. Leaf262]|uniref:hypothetical protein n=1 Tax=Rhizobium sp. Leaf262 TaxID=1736312 RepID=UPI0007144903|nr:hypothetical protein [Rhizobium sp. Leaf262]KQO76938.1 hypothetical protein ASF29_07485 [Rhizobium sp. Leaf262]